MSKMHTNLSRSLLLLALLVTATTLSAQYRGGSGDGSFAASASSAIAPLDLLAFAAQAEAQTVHLNWRTTNEYATRRFDVERSTDGRQFVSIGKVSARGYTRPGVEIPYSFVDTSPPGDNLYYRLVTVDLDGTAERSPVVSVSLQAPTAIVDLFPNPNRGRTLYLRVDPAAADHSLRVEIFDAAGRNLLESHELNPGHGETSLQLDRPLRAGSYLVRFYAARQALPPRLLIVTE